MNPIEQLCPYRNVDTDKCSRIQGDVSTIDKNTILSAVPDRGVYNLLIQSAVKRTADFIRDNHINYYDSTDQSRVIDFICHGTDQRVDRTAVAHVDTRAATGVHDAPKTTRRKPAGGRQGAA